jgi:hypothetical protein
MEFRVSRADSILRAFFYHGGKRGGGGHGEILMRSMIHNLSTVPALYLLSYLRASVLFCFEKSLMHLISW